MDLHYSQTFYYITVRPFIVSLPYGFTLFSNPLPRKRTWRFVSLPYGFTLFSNPEEIEYITNDVSLPYGFTLFSNDRERIAAIRQGFTTLWIYTILKLCCCAYPAHLRFTTLWIYTILKPQISCAHYTAQGKSTRSSTIVLWRNGIVKGAQIPIQHIEFGAHIYARRCLAL